jgi:hypothetical protein
MPAIELSLPDFGDLLLGIALLFGALIVFFEALERRREGVAERRLLETIAQEYAHFRRLGHF